MDENNKYIDALTKDFASPTRPLHVTVNSWDEKTKQLEERIRGTVPFEGKIESYVEGYKLMIPASMHGLLKAGGVLTVSTEEHLWLFGAEHWLRMQRNLAKEVGLSPVHNKLARHIYSKMYKFSTINDDGTIDIPPQLLNYAGIKREVAIIGMVYHAEIHSKEAYVAEQAPEKQKSLRDLFRKLKF